MLERRRPPLFPDLLTAVPLQFHQGNAGLGTLGSAPRALPFRPRFFLLPFFQGGSNAAIAAGA